jgi:general secretion pathway protein D
MRGAAGVAACVLAGLDAPWVQAGDGPVAGIVTKEIARRNQRMQEGRILITEGGLLYSKGDFALSASTYRQAWDILPDSPMSAQLRSEARDGYSRAAVAYAGKLAAEARYEEARALLKTVLAADFDPDNVEAKVLEKRLDDPDRYEPALTPLHLANVEKVEKELRLASGYMTLGDYDRANLHFQEVLRIDSYNQAARRGMERVEQHKSEYFDTARDHARAKALAEVDRGWEDAVPALDLTALFGAPRAEVGVLGRKETVLNKLRSFTIPVVEMQGASLAEVVEFLRIRTREMDPQKKGVDFVLRVSPDLAARPLSLNMVGAPVEEVLRYATEMTGTVYRVEEFAITITSQSERSTSLITKSYRVPPDFLQNAPAAAAPTTPDPFAPAGGGGTAGGFAGLQIRRLGPKEFLAQRGVIFPDGSSASYMASTNILIVTNTAENLAMVDTLVEQASSSTPKQVEVSVRMLEVNDLRLRELGFDWLMGQFNVPGSNRIFASGGTLGNQRGGAFTQEDFPFATPTASGETIPPVGVNPITAGLRSTGNIFGKPSIDQLIGQLTPVAIDSRSPGAFAISGVFTDPQFQMVMRALSQNKGVDVLAAPSVVTKSGQRANVALVREFIYPTEFDPPQIPQTVGDPTTRTVAPVFVPPIVPVTPSTPTAFEKRDVGIVLDVEPVIGDDNRTVDLNLVPSTVEFEGFIDYGEPIKFTGSAAPPSGFATLNRILQPIFRTNKVTTNVTVWDGQTVVLGGVMMEKSQTIKDKVPVVGDLPLIGRTFQSRVQFTEKKNVIFFVTVRVIDPGGNRVNQPIIEDPAAAVR